MVGRSRDQGKLTGNRVSRRGDKATTSDDESHWILNDSKDSGDVLRLRMLRRQHCVIMKWWLTDPALCLQVSLPSLSRAASLFTVD